MDSSTYLTGVRLQLVVLVLNLCNLVAFMDNFGCSAILESIAIDFDAAETISWANTSQLIGAVVGLSFLGYLSNLLGRKPMLLVAVSILCVATLLCGLCHYTDRRAPLFFCFRALAGVGTGSISNLVNIAQNNVLTAGKRAKYQGFQGVSVAIGSAAGLLVGAAFARQNPETALGWPALYYIEAALATVAIVLLSCFMPALKPRPLDKSVRRTIMTIDWCGITSGAAAVVPLLAALTEGPKLGWGSRTTIALFATGGVFFVIFLILGYTQPLKRQGVRPIVPFHLFRNQAICIILVQNICFGAAFYSFIVYMPMYWRDVSGLSGLKAAALLLPYIVTHGTWSATSPRVMMRLCPGDKLKAFKYMAAFGFACWTAGMLTIGLAPVPTMPLIGTMEVLVGLGSGSVFQNSVNAIRCQITDEDQASALSARNVIRFLGGAIGTAATGSVNTLVFRRSLPPTLHRFNGLAFEKVKNQGLSLVELEASKATHRTALQAVFAFGGIAIAICFISCIFVRANPPGLPVSVPVTPPESGDISRASMELSSTAPSRWDVKDGRKSSHGFSTKHGV